MAKHGAMTWPLQWDPGERRTPCGRGGVSTGPPCMGPGRCARGVGGSGEDGDTQTPLGKEPLAVGVRPRWVEGRQGKVRRGMGKEMLGPPPAFLGWARSRRESTVPFWPFACGHAQQPMHEGLRSPWVGAGDRGGATVVGLFQLLHTFSPQSASRCEADTAPRGFYVVGEWTLCG